MKKSNPKFFRLNLKWLIGALIGGIVLGFGINWLLYNPSISRDLNLGIRHHVSPPWISKNIDFAGERVPMEILDVRERFERELMINTFWESNTLLMMKNGARWLPLIDSILIANGVPSDFKFLPIVESRLSNEVSSKGAAGFWHLMPHTAREMGLVVNEELDERYHPVMSTLAAIKYLKRARDIFGSWTMAAASYNRGISGLRRAVNHQKQKDFYDIKLNDESARYVFRVLAFKQLFMYPKKYGFFVRKDDLYQMPLFKTEEVTSPVDWAEFSEKNNLTYKHLRVWNPWIQDPKFRNISKKGTTVWILVDPKMAQQTQKWDSIPASQDSSGLSYWDPWADSLFLDRVE